MIVDEAFQTAITLLNERGELLNVDLYELVGQDKDLFRQLRKSLIAQGFAEDVSGTRLKATQQAPLKRSDSQLDSDDQKPETKLPGHALLTEPIEGDVEIGPSISFSEADFLPLRGEKPKATLPPSPVPQSQPDHQEPNEGPVLVSLDLATDGRSLASRLNERKMLFGAMVLIAITIAVTSVPWNYPPDARSIYQEFKQYYDQAKEMRPRAASDPGEWQRVMSHSRSRVQSIVKALKDVRTGASAKHPEKQELLWAGSEGLLKLLENPEIDKNEEERLRAKFERHMSEARWLLDGGTRNALAKQVAPKDSPGAGKGYLGK